MKCAACQATQGAKVFGVIVDGEPLRTQVPLCQMHGDRFLLRVGNLMGEALREGLEQDQHKPGGDA